jgi:hypothetical protein
MLNECSERREIVMTNEHRHLHGQESPLPIKLSFAEMERNIAAHKMRSVITDNFVSYRRKADITGYIEDVDYTNLREAYLKMRIVSSFINYMAKQTNTSTWKHEWDVFEIKALVDEISMLLGRELSATLVH